MNGKLNNILVARVEGEVDSLLRAHEFSRCGSRMWLRKWGWKTDAVDIVLKTRGILVNLYVWIPPGNMGREHGIDSLKVAMIDSRELISGASPILRFPFLGVLRAGYMKQVICVVAEGLVWFDRLGTPAEAWAYAEQHMWNTKSAGAQYCRDYLRSLPPEAQQREARVRLNHEYPSEYSRAMFDLDWQGPMPNTLSSDDDDE
jgi:hypothetical protein